MKLLSRICIVLVVLSMTISSSSAKSITNIEDIQPGANVTVQGQVTRILDEDEFRLRDDTGSVKVYIGWKNRVIVNVGENITVEGVVDDDVVGNFRPELYARQIVREDGSVVELNQ